MAGTAATQTAVCFPIVILSLVQWSCPISSLHKRGSKCASQKHKQKHFDVPYQELSLEPSNVAKGAPILVICEEELRGGFSFCQRPGVVHGERLLPFKRG